MKWIQKIKSDLDNKIEQEAKEAQDPERVDFRSILNGKILISNAFFKLIPMLLFLIVIAIFYINNRFRYESYVRRQNEIKEIRNDLQTTHLVKMSKLMEISTRSSVIERLKEKGSTVCEPQTPPIVISK